MKPHGNPILRLIRQRFPMMALALPAALGWLLAATPLQAATASYGNTTISYTVRGVGSVTREEESIDPPTIPQFWSFYNGVDPESGKIVPSSGTVAIDITVVATDGKIYKNEELVNGVGLTNAMRPWSADVAVGQTVTAVLDYSVAEDDANITSFQVMHGYNGTAFSAYMDVLCNVDTAYWTYVEANEDMAGGPDDNEDTAFDSGGQGSCSSQGLPTYAVNTSFLTLTAEDTDFAYQSFGQRVAMTRTWNMPPAAGGLFGNGWSFAYASTVEATGLTSGTATVLFGNGQKVAYAVSGTQGPSGGFIPVSFACQSKGRRPVLTGYVPEGGGAAHYLLYDRDRRLTWRYEYAGVDAGRGVIIHRLVSVADDNGNALSVGYDDSGRLVSLTDASGRATTFAYDAQNRVSAMRTFAGTAASYAYDASGNLKFATDLHGNVSTFGYDADNSLTSMSTAGRTTTFGYGTVQYRKRLTSVTDPSGKVRSYAMVSGETRVTDPGGGVRAYANTRGRTNMIRDPLSQTTSITYTDAGLPMWIFHPGGGVETYEYDASGNPTRHEDAENAVTVMTYDQAGDMLTLTDPGNNVWTWTYDANRNPTSLTTPLGRQTTFAYDAKGLQTSVTAPGGAASSFTHDVHGNLTGIASPTGETLTYAYDAHGLERVSATDGRGNATTFAYDANRRRTRMTLAGGARYDYAYDCCAPSSVTDPLGAVTTYERDALLRPTRIIDPSGKALTLAYDQDGRLKTRTDPLGRVTSYGFDGAGRLTRLASPLGGHVDYGRDDRGRIVSLTDQRGKTTTFNHDNQNRLINQTDPSGRMAFNLTRDAMGRVTTWSNARMGQVNYAYDADGRLTTKQHGATVAAAYGYAPSGLLSSVSDPSGASGALGLTRDTAGRVTNLTYPDGLTLGVTYDAAGNVAAMTYPGGMVATYAHDARNRTTRVTFGDASMDIAYDAAGRLTSETRSNGVSSSYAFDAAGRLTRIRHLKGATTIVDLTQTRDAAGQVTAESGTVPVAPTLTTRQLSGEYDDADKPVSFGADAFTSDADGNVTAVSGSRTLAMAYDNENRLTSLTSGGVTTSYLYNGLGDRTRSTTGSATRNFRHDPLGRLAFETDASGAVTVLYIWVGSRLAAYGTVSGGFAWPLYDRVGGTLALTDGTGTVTAGYAYSPYGARVGASGSASTSFTFIGAYGVMHEGGGIHFMKNRFYDAATGRFLQRDPIGFAGGNNLYNYVGNNPIDRVDPAGQAWFFPMLGVGATAGVAYETIRTGGQAAAIEGYKSAYHDQMNALGGVLSGTRAGGYDDASVRRAAALRAKSQARYENDRNTWMKSDNWLVDAVNSFVSSAPISSACELQTYDTTSKLRREYQREKDKRYDYTTNSQEEVPYRGEGCPYGVPPGETDIP